MKAHYTFSASGTLPSGNKVKCSGDLVGEDYEPGSSFPPHSVFEQARTCVEKTFPGIVLKGDEVINGIPVKSYPTVARHKAKTKKLQEKQAEKVPA